MVGRPGRSKGCFKCRKRHLKCDESRPGCLNCQKARVECPGYPATFFIDESAAWREKAVVRAPQRSSPSTSSTLSPGPSLLAACEEICRCYLHNSLATWSRIRYPVKDYPVWPGFRALDCKGDLPQICFNSFAFTLFGKAHSLDRVQTDGYQLYGQALTRLKTALDNPADEKQVEMVVSILILSSFEFLTATSRAGWIEHALGLATMFERVGPAFFTRTDTSLLLESSRQLMILAAIAARKPTFLAQQAWKDIPWSTNNLPKSEQQRFLDLMADIPAIVRKFRRFCMAWDSVARPRQAEDLKRQVVELLQRLHLWRTSWDAWHQDDVWDDHSGTAKLPLPWDTPPLEFRYAQVTNEMLNYDATVLLLLELIENMRDQGIDFQYEDVGLATGEDKTGMECKRLILEICRGIPWYIAKANNMLINLDLIYPIRLAWRSALRYDRALSSWLEGVVGSLPQDNGWLSQHATVEYDAPVTD